MPNVMSSATVAVFGDNGTQTYTPQKLAGIATFGPIEYVDIEYSITKTPGLLIPTRNVFGRALTAQAAANHVSVSVVL